MENKPSYLRALVKDTSQNKKLRDMAQGIVNAAESFPVDGKLLSNGEIHTIIAMAFNFMIKRADAISSEPGMNNQDVAAKDEMIRYLVELAVEGTL